MLAQSGGDLDKFRSEIEREVRYANIAIIEGIGASQHGIGMVSARIAEIVLRDERALIPIGAYQPRLRGHAVVAECRRIERGAEVSSRRCRRRAYALQRSADTLKAATGRIKV